MLSFLSRPEGAFAASLRGAAGLCSDSLAKSPEMGLSCSCETGGTTSSTDVAEYELPWFWRLALSSANGIRLEARYRSSWDPTAPELRSAIPGVLCGDRLARSQRLMSGMSSGQIPPASS